MDIGYEQPTTIFFISLSVSLHLFDLFKIYIPRDGVMEDLTFLLPDIVRCMFLHRSHA